MNKQTQLKLTLKTTFHLTTPGGWEIAEATAPNVVVAVADPNTVENGNPTTLVVIQKPDIASGSDLNNVYTQNYANFFNNTYYQRVSEGNITINGQNALENIYKTNSTVDPKAI